jgi:hypothetical protein
MSKELFKKMCYHKKATISQLEQIKSWISMREMEFQHERSTGNSA